MTKNRLTDLAQKLRREATPEEISLWYHYLREHPLQFRRQKIIGPYIVVFYCHKAKLVVELDGSQHLTQGLSSDLERTSYLEKQGIHVLRFLNSDVQSNLDGICEEIEQAIKQRNI